MSTERYTDVMKVGGSLLGVENEDKQLVGRNDKMFNLVGKEVSTAKNNIMVVSSFAVGMGMLEVGESDRPEEMEEVQAHASVGQPLLHARWDKSIKGKTTGQVLLAEDEIQKDGPASKLAQTLRTVRRLFLRGAVPIGNENDPITNKELWFGGNDILAAVLAVAMQRSKQFGQIRLFLLTDVNGVYRNREDPNTRIPVIESAHQYKHVAEGSESQFTIGGMESKFEAAQRTQFSEWGVPTYIYNPADGSREQAVAGDIGTYFPVWTPRT